MAYGSLTRSEMTSSHMANASSPLRDVAIEELSHDTPALHDFPFDFDGSPVDGGPVDDGNANSGIAAEAAADYYHEEEEFPMADLVERLRARFDWSWDIVDSLTDEQLQALAFTVYDERR